MGTMSNHHYAKNNFYITIIIVCKLFNQWWTIIFTLTMFNCKKFEVSLYTVVKTRVGRFVYMKSLLPQKKYVHIKEIL